MARKVAKVPQETFDDYAVDRRLAPVAAASSAARRLSTALGRSALSCRGSRSEWADRPTRIYGYLVRPEVADRPPRD